MACKMYLRQLLVLVLISNLTISLNSAPFSNSDALLPDNIQHMPSNFKKPLLARKDLGKWRKELVELNDYPGTGPNPGHTPGPPPAGGK